jgi:2,4'-dihydroxyacetophenone dioxygenase
MQPRTTDHLRTADLDWIPLSPGLAFKPITFLPGDAGYQLLLRVDPGTVIPRHRHTGEVHALVLSGARRIVGETDDIVAGTYVYEPAGNVDSWRAVGDEPCVIHIEVNGRIEYLDDAGAVVRHTDATTARAEYLAWCAATGTAVHPALTVAA